MIRLELPWLVFLSLFACLAAISLVWIAGEVARRRRAARQLARRVQCQVCRMEYDRPPPHSGDLPTCPRCGSRNEPVPPRIF